jgi:CBS domain-containing protein
MRVTGNVGTILGIKGSAVWSVDPDETVYRAITLMDEKNIGAVLVMQSERLVGIMSERDYTRKVILKGRSSRDTRVREIMAASPITVGLQQTVDACLHIMTEHRIRHLPVVENERVLGLISIGDLVNWVISAQSAAIDHLEGYISGRYPG